LACAVMVYGSLQAQEVPFKKIVLTEKFYGEGIHLVDLNEDGEMDVIFGPFICEGPDFTRRTTYYDPVEFDPHDYSDNYMIGTYDFNGDGYLDIFKYGRAGMQADWFENPGKKGGPWVKHFALEAPGNEARYFVDLDNDG